VSKKFRTSTPATTLPTFFSGKNFFRNTIIAIAALAILLYANSIPNGYSIDDNYVSKSHPLVSKGVTAIPEIFSSHTITNIKGERYSYRPVVLTSFAIEHSVFGENPQASHFINVLIYALTCIFLFALFRFWFQEKAPWLALIATLLFIIHPVHTEPVNNLKSRDELLALLFSILALYRYGLYAANGKMSALLTGSLFLALAVLSKASAVSVIFLAPLAVFFFSKGNWRTRLAVFIAPLLTVLLLFAASRLLLPEGESREMMYHENPLVIEKGIEHRISVALYSLGYFLKLIFIPYPLLYYYGFAKIPLADFSHPVVYLSLLVHLALMVVAIAGLRKKTIPAFAILFYLGSIAMFSNLAAPSPGVVADRFLYFPSIGFAIGIAWLLIKWLKPQQSLKQMRITAFVLIALSLISGFLIFNRNSNWKNNLTLYAADNKHLQSSVKANLDYGTQLILAFKNQQQWESMLASDPSDARPKKELDALNQDLTSLSFTNNRQIILEARKCFERATELLPTYHTSWANLGSTYFFEGDFQTGLDLFLKAHALNPHDAEITLNLAASYEKLGDLEKAIDYNTTTIRAMPHDERAWKQMKRVYDNTSNYQGWIAFNQRMADENLPTASPYQSLGDYYMKNADWHSALGYYERAYPFDSTNTALVRNLANLHQEIGDPGKAQFYFQKLAQLESMP
jgi:tetratricopeptide (TPR) repeat protein